MIIFVGVNKFLWSYEYLIVLLITGSIIYTKNKNLQLFNLCEFCFRMNTIISKKEKCPVKMCLFQKLCSRPQKNVKHFPEKWNIIFEIQYTHQQYLTWGAKNTRGATFVQLYFTSLILDLFYFIFWYLFSLKFWNTCVL